jgi:predicted negative regulator of RcsB-dependent stress response
VRADFEFLAVQGLIRANKHAQAQTKLEKMAREILPTDPQAARVQVHLAQCQVVAKNFGPAEAKLKELVGANIDGGVKGLVYNTLGDICQETKRPDDAFWNYLWVDVVYNQDKHEQAKALYNLAKLFSEVRNDPARAQQCRERLLHDKDFQGLAYQKLAAKEKKD